MARRYPPDTGTDPRTRAMEDAAGRLVDAQLRLNQERNERCASKDDVAFWQGEVYRLRIEYEKVSA